MRHRVAGRKLGRNSGHRKALSRNLVLAFFEREKIQTTLAKAKNIQPLLEKLITMAKTDDFHHRALVFRHLPKGKSSAHRALVTKGHAEVASKKVIKNLFEVIAKRYAERQGGYTRIVKLGHRLGDSAEMAIIELV